MENTVTSSASQQKIHLPSLLMLLLTGFGLLSCLGTAGGAFVLGLFSLAGQFSALENVQSLFALAWISAGLGALLVPSLVMAFLRLINRDSPLFHIHPSPRLSSWFMLFYPVLLIVGGVVSSVEGLAVTLLPPIQVLAIVIPVWWLIETGRRSLNVRDPQRAWGVLSVGITVSSTVIMAVEVIILILAAVLAGIWLSQNPALMEQFTRIMQRLANAEMNPVVIERILKPLLKNPLFTYATITFTAGLVPLVEELFKPLAVWLLAGKRLTPRQGFVFGMISGGSFALVESLMMFINPAGSDWTVWVIGRLGTLLLHITTAGLLGWALASTWRDGKYIRVLLIYVVDVTIHALWNVFAILAGLQALLPLDEMAQNTPLLARLGIIAPGGLMVLSVLLFALFTGANRFLRRRDNQLLMV
jgi:hypothetical protein